MAKKKPRTLIVLGCAFLLALAMRAAQAVEHWTVYDSFDPEGPLAITTFDSSIYFSTLGNQIKGVIRKSVDGQTWEIVTLPDSGLVMAFASYQGALYAFALEDSLTGPGGNTSRKLFRTKDGVSWQRIDSGAFGKGPGWSGTIVYNDFLYAADLDGSVWRTDGQQDPPVWQSVPLTTDIKGMPRFAVYGGYVYMMCKAGDSTKVYRTTDFTTWAPRLSGNLTRNHDSFAAIDGLLYWGDSALIKTDGTTTNTEELPRGDGSSIFDIPMPFVLHGRLFAFMNLFQPMLKTTVSSILNDPGVWEAAGDSSSSLRSFGGQRIDNSTTQLKDMAFLVLDKLLMLRNGIAAVSPEAILTNSLRAGQQNQIVLAWSVQINFNETLQSLTVRNLGTAEGGPDIKAARLLLAVNDARAPQPYIALTDLNLGADNKSWITPPTYHLDLHDGDKFYIAVDVEANPRNDRTCQFSIAPTGFAWGISQTYRPAAITSASALAIAGNSSTQGPIDGVEVYPKPARDAVFFLYDLPVDSDIAIRILDLKAQLVSEIKDMNKPAGTQLTTKWDASAKAPGTYYAVIHIKPASGSERVYKKKVFIQR